MRAGTHEQMDFLYKHFMQHSYGADSNWPDFATACDALKEAGLYRVMLDGVPYNYGTGWLKEPVPEDVLEWLVALPAYEWNDDDEDTQ